MYRMSILHKQFHVTACYSFKKLLNQLKSRENNDVHIAEVLGRGLRTDKGISLGT